MKNADVRALAKKEMVREKDHILRTKNEVPSLLEKAALDWKKKRKAAEREKENEKIQKEGEQNSGFLELSALQTVQHDKEKLFQDTNWSQLKLSQEEEAEKEEISINMATVRSMAKKLMAREWRRALGKVQECGLNSLEKEASSWKERKDEEKRKKEEMKRNLERQNRIFKEALFHFGQEIKQEKEALKPERAASLLEETLGSIGEVIDIEWHKQECYIWIEPWEAKKTRRISGDTLPVVYRAKIDENLNLASYGQVEGESIRLKMKDRLLYKPLQGLLIKDEEEAEGVLEEALSEMGQIIDLKRTKKGWTVSFEPWERMRKRNVENKGKGPVNCDQIEVNWAEGEFSLAPK